MSDTHSTESVSRLEAWLESETAYQAIVNGLEDVGLYGPSGALVESIQWTLVQAFADEVLNGGGA